MSEQPVDPPPATEVSDRILIRSVNWLGDAVMTTPALIRLREARPRANLTLLTHEKLADLWRQHPAVDDVITFSSREGIGAVAQKIRAGRFGTGIVFPNSHRSALEMRLAGVPVRIGVATPLRRLLLTHPLPRPAGFVAMRKRPLREIQQLAAGTTPARPALQDPMPPEAHHVHHYLHLVATLGANRQPLPPRLVVSEQEVRDAVSKFVPDFENRPDAADSNPPSPVFAICPAAEYGPAKRWPVENFITAAREISLRTGCRWIIFGGPREVPLAEMVAGGIGSQARNLAGKTSLRELMSLLRFSRLLLSNDTGPMHLAAAVGTHVAALFGSTSPGLTGPGLPGDPRHRLLCSHAACAPCFLRECPIDFRCMKGIDVTQVVDAVVELHERNPAGKIIP